MKLEVHPEVARMERNAARLLYALGAFALVLSAAVIFLEYKRYDYRHLSGNRDVSERPRIQNPPPR